MMYKCIKELIRNGETIMSVGDLVLFFGTVFHNITTRMSYNDITYSNIEGCVVSAGTAVATTDFERITTGMYETYKRKNHDYGNSFDQSLDKFGLIASVVRLGDKMNRIESLVNKEAQVKEESIRDTLLDLAGYCVMTIMWMDKQL